MSGRAVLRRGAVAVLLLCVAGLVFTGLRLTDFDTSAVQNVAVRGSDVRGDVRSAAAVPRVEAADTLRGSQLLPPASIEETLAVRELLVTRADALLAGDRRQWAVTTPYDNGAQTRTQMALFDRLRALRPTAWAYGDEKVSVPLGESGAPGERTLSVAYRLRYSLAPGGAIVTRDQALTVTGSAGRWWVSDVSPPATAPAGGYAAAGASGDQGGLPAVDLWDLTPVVRAVGDRCVVIGSPQRTAWVRWFAGHCGAAQATVDAAVPGAGSRPGRTLLVVPTDVRQLARLLGRTGTAGLEQTAAVTIGPVHAPAEAVLMNADAFAQLRGIGRRVVLTHELVHVATRASRTADVPTWLDEGLADEIAYRGTNLSRSTIAGPAIRAARAGRLPDALPTAQDFDAAAPDTATGGAALAYARAWSAVDAIANTAGLAKLVELHHLISTGTAQDAAFEQVLGLSQAEFLDMWRQHLRALART